MSKTLSVSAIEQGTVIDHITAGQALRIIHMLRLLDKQLCVTVGLNLSSRRLQRKDLIKIENYQLSREEANKTTIFAPDVTINIIKDFNVVEKMSTHLPERVEEVFVCPNLSCITHGEMLQSQFVIEEQASVVKLICLYCEKIFDRNSVKVSKI